MSIFNIGLILFIIGLVVSVVLYKKLKKEYIMVFVAVFVIGSVLSLVYSIWQPISLTQEKIRQLKEKQQIEYQIENLTEDKDKIKLNEWILTYNDWVNDVNAEKETWGWFAWHWNFDMSEFEIIDLV